MNNNFRFNWLAGGFCTGVGFTMVINGNPLLGLVNIILGITNIIIASIHS